MLNDPRSALLRLFTAALPPQPKPVRPDAPAASMLLAATVRSLSHAKGLPGAGALVALSQHRGRAERVKQSSGITQEFGSDEASTLKGAAS